MQQQRLKEQTAALLKASGSMSKSACSLQPVKYYQICLMDQQITVQFGGQSRFSALVVSALVKFAS